MIPRLPTAPLERAITERLPLSALCASPCELLDGMRVADYVGSYRMRHSRYGEHDLIGASAQVFFEEDGLFIGRHDGSAHGREYAIALFATFLVVEFNAFTPEAHFLVLAPALKEADGARYHGLWAAQRLESLQLALGEPGAEQALFAELDLLLENLNRNDGAPRAEQPPHGWLARLFWRPRKIARQMTKPQLPSPRD